jgi:hypothetical protein
MLEDAAKQLTWTKRPRGYRMRIYQSPEEV